MASETPAEQSVKIGNFLTGMGLEYNRFGSMLVVAPVEPVAGRRNVCLRAYYHPDYGYAAKPVLQDGVMSGLYIRETLETAVRLAVFTLLGNIVTADNIFLCISEEGPEIPSVYSFEIELEEYEDLAERQKDLGMEVEIAGKSGSVKVEDINVYIDKTLLSIMRTECSE